ncbi:hypothetical protein [Nonomuraea sp. B19D2]
MRTVVGDTAVCTASFQATHRKASPWPALVPEDLRDVRFPGCRR